MPSRSKVARGFDWPPIQIPQLALDRPERGVAAALTMIVGTTHFVGRSIASARGRSVLDIAIGDLSVNGPY